ncbi:MAG: S26 family signal peptidase [Spirochaetaceae bacterium]|jgi:signal peptidase I|nr:S26 family signal peptidase [Spirochaetaceae bacterium]
MTAHADFFDRLCTAAEAVLSRRKRRARLRKEKQRTKNQLLDWLEAFVQAAAMVLVINQYLFQAYEIPSGSMIDTLMIRDKIFVNKLVFGPELLPGLGKLPSPFTPARNDVVIFENPSYISRGPVFDIAQRVIFMLTLSVIDIDRDVNGEQRAHFLIKRAAGLEGDHFISRDGDMLIRFAGTGDYTPERDHNAARGFGHHLSRLVEAALYPRFREAGRLAAYFDLGLDPPAPLREAAAAFSSIPYPDYFTVEEERLAFIRGAYPQDKGYRARLARQKLGWYVPEGYFFPLGDNRDNSRDGRYFGPVRKTRALGKGAFIFWPFRRAGAIR